MIDQKSKEHYTRSFLLFSVVVFGIPGGIEMLGSLHPGANLYTKQ